MTLFQSKQRLQCKAKSKRSGERCRRWASIGFEVCYIHGARGGAPKGNKNAVKTGEHETIFKETLTPEEQGLFHSVNTDKIQAIDEQIRLALIRERRMMQRIARLAGVEMTVVERVYDISREADEPGSGAVLVEKSRGTLGQIQHIEEALTRVQDQVRKLLVEKHRFETGAPPDGEELDRLFENMRRSRAALENGEADGD